MEELISNTINEIKEEYKTLNNNLDLTNTCDLFQALTYYKFKDLNFEVYPIETQDIISNDVEGHSLLLIKYQDFQYLIDLTYEQFFKEDKCNKENYLINKEYNIIMLAPLPGYYYKLHPENSYVAQKLIKDGFIEANEETIKAYFDSFYLTRRGRIVDNKIPTESNILASTYVNAIYKNAGSVHHTKEELNSTGYNIDVSITR